MKFDVRADIGQVKRMLKRIPRQSVAPATYRALNKTATSVRAKIARDIAKDLGIKVSAVKKNLKISRANSVRLVATLTANGKKVRLIDTRPKPRQNKSGISYTSGGQRKQVNHGFIQTMPKSGHTGVFKRIPGSRMRSNPHKEKIVELHSTSVPKVFLQKDTQIKLQTLAQLTFKKVFEQELRFEFIKRGYN